MLSLPRSTPRRARLRRHDNEALSRPPSNRPFHMKAITMMFHARVYVAACSLFWLTVGLAEAQVFVSIDEIDVPSRGVSEEPSLVALPDGRVLMSWTELSGPTFAAVRIALRDDDGWSKPVTVAEGDDLFVNYADFPSVVGLPDGTIAVQWLRMNDASSYAYDVNIALSSDGGATWGETMVPHRDGSPRQHGFVSLLPDGPNGRSGHVARWPELRHDRRLCCGR